MKDADLERLAIRAGIAVEWTDYANVPRKVAPPTLRRVLQALGLPCATKADLRESLHRLEVGAASPVIMADAQAPIPLPQRLRAKRAKLVLENGTERAISPGDAYLRVPEPGRHRLVADASETPLIVAPKTCFRLEDVAPGRRFSGLAAQVYSLAHAGDCGIGDLGGVTALARSAAALGIDALALSPMHALFSSDPDQFSPYSPSSRLFLNPLHADPVGVLGEALAREAAEQAGLSARAASLQAASLIDWPEAAHAKSDWLRALYDILAERRGENEALWRDLGEFRRAGGDLLEWHACFETLHAARRTIDGSDGDWRRWPAGLRSPAGAAIEPFVEAQAREIEYHVFLQWLAERSLAKAQQAARDAGMSIGLVSDLAVGMNPVGSHAWSRPQDILVGLKIGAPPDLINLDGQDWGLTTFSPQALMQTDFEPFAATLRAAMRHAGGIRIDHVMGLRRLWLIPEGAPSSEGAYLSYPFEDLMRVIALESMRHRAVVVAEDLGTVPKGFRAGLAARGVLGMNVLWFERDGRRFRPARQWPPDGMAVTSTHDLPTLAGWWSGHDIGVRHAVRHPGDAGWRDEQEATRASDRAALWEALKQAGLVEGPMPGSEEIDGFIEAALRFVAQTPSPLALFPLEDVLGLRDQPNLPGTIDEHPNWRRRLTGEAGSLLTAAVVRLRLAKIGEERSRS